MRPGFNIGVDPVNYEEPQSILDETLKFAAQFGATDLIVQSYKEGAVPGQEKWELEDILALKKNVESHGCKIEAFENVPTRFYDHVMLGGPKRDEQIENMIYTVRNIARAGVGIFGYNWMPSRVWRTQREMLIRGEAKATAFDYSLVEKSLETYLNSSSRDLWDQEDIYQVDGKPGLTHGRLYEDEEMWKNLEYWIKIITPIAEEEGIRLGIHPCDPPVPKLGGVAQLFRSFDAYKRLIEIYPSNSNAIEFCQGTFSEMNEDIYEMIKYFGEKDKILYVHFRNVSGQVPKFHEEFINTGYVDMHKAMEIYNEVGFKGVFVDDHVPVGVNDTTWGHRGRAFANGYIQATIDSVKRNAK